MPTLRMIDSPIDIPGSGFSNPTTFLFFFFFGVLLTGGGVGVIFRIVAFSEQITFLSDLTGMGHQTNTENQDIRDTIQKANHDFLESLFYVYFINYTQWEPNNLLSF